MKYFIKIFGCQYNEWDGARLDFLLQKIGLIPAEEKQANIVFLLSCSVRKSAVDRVMGIADNNANKKVIVTGCVLDDDKKKYEKKNIYVWDINKLNDLISILQLKHYDNETMHQLASEGSVICSYLPIMIGCNNFCSYCAVPYTRGRERSRDFDEVVSDFRKLIEKGHKTITLLGQNVNSYNPAVISTHPEPTAGWIEGGEKSHRQHSPFSLLLHTLNNIPGNFNIRFTSNHPKDMSDEIIAAVRDLPKVIKEIHLPLQSGSNKILKAMNRPYTKELYLSLVEKIKKEIPEVKLTTDVIVGFPGETEQDFQETVEVYGKVGYFQSFTNKYSPRSGTAAFKLGDPIPWKEKQRRWKILNDIANKKNYFKNFKNNTL